MLTLLLALLVCAGLLLRGSWDLWAQTALFTAVSAGTALWLSSRLLIGYVPLPPRRVLLWAAGLGALAGLSAWLSPVSAYALPAWRVWLLSLWIFPALCVISKDGRAFVDESLRAAAWVLLLLALYQRFHGLERPTSALLNQNVFAGTLLMLLPLAAARRDWMLTGGLLLALAWTKSVGAWLGLAAALMVAGWRSGGLSYRAGAAIGAVCLVLVYAKFELPDTPHRWMWWEAAWRMSLDRPLLGYGPGSYAFALPAYEAAGRPLGTLYAHQLALEVAAENGWPFLLGWLGGIFVLVRRLRGPKAFGAVAVLVHSLWDYPLSIPGNLWLFSYLAASALAEERRGAGVPAPKKPLLIAAAAAAGALTAGWALRAWEAERLRAGAAAAFRAGAEPAALIPRLDRSAALAAHPETERMAAELELERVRRGERLFEEGARAAAARLERAAALDPFRGSTRAALERLYRQLGEEEKARAVRERSPRR